MTSPHLCALLLLALTCARPRPAAADQPAAPPVTPPAATPAYRLGTDVVPTAQAVRLSLDPDRPGYSGAVTVELAVRRATPRLRFHAAPDMKLDRVTLRRHPAGPALPVTVSRDGAFVTLVTAAPLSPGAYTLSIHFQHQLGTRAVGLYRMVQEGRGYAFTQFESTDARKAFPCWDEPGFKIPYQITLQIPAGQEGVSNTPVDRDTTAAGVRTLVFRKTRPLPSYLLAMAVGPLESVPLPDLGVPGRLYAPRGQARLAQLAPKLTPPILRALERYFGSRYPYEKLDFIAIPEYWPGAMEHPGAITFSDQLLLLDERSASPAQQRTLALVTAHELAHQWFGDLVTMAWWDELWLNESFADWMAHKIVDELYPQYHLQVSNAGDVQRVMHMDARPTTESIRQEVTDADSILTRVGLDYDKGKAVLAMFEGYLGAGPFQQGIRTYLAAHRDQNAVAADLWRALSQTAAGADVAAAMATFLNQPGLPLVSATVLPDGKVRLTQRRFTNAGVAARDQLWQVPVALKYSVNGQLRTRTVLLKQAAQDFDLGGRPAWLFPLANAVGYYRFEVSPAAVPALIDREARSAAVIDQGQLSSAERVALLGDLGALLSAGRLGGADYLNALSRFAADPDPQVLLALLGGLGKVESAFITEPLRAPFAAYVRKLLGPAKARFGLLPRPGEDDRVTLLRPHLLGWLGDAGQDADAGRLADTAASRLLQAQADAAPVNPSLRDTVLRVAARRGDRALFDQYRRRFEGAKDPNEREHFLQGLGSFRAPALQDEALRYALSGPLRPNEFMQIAFFMMDREPGRDRVFSWFTSNYAAITTRIPELFLSMMPNLAGGCEPARVQRARAFFATPGHSVTGTTRELGKVEEAVRDCADLRAREGAAVAAYLQRS